MAEADKAMFYSVATLLGYASNASNFFLYFASGRKFRAAFVSLFSACGTDHGHDVMVT